YDPLYGARPLKRVIRKQVEDGLAKAMLGGEVAPDTTVVVDVDDQDGFTITSRVPGPSVADPAA
ncbi:MAG: hypothetical protein ACOCT8_04470, partial [Actinomycetota bacterium]